MPEKETKNTAEKTAIQNFEVHSLKDADRALQLLGICDADLGRLQAKLNRKISKAQDEIRPDLETIEMEMKELINALQKYSEENKDQLFAEKRSLEMNYGTIGFQKSAQLVCQSGVDWKQVLEVAKKAYPDYVAATWNLVKEAIKKAPERTQDKLGILIEEKDTFYAAGKDKKRYQVS